MLAISFLGPFSAQWTDSFSLSWQAFTPFYKIRPAANSDWLDRFVQFKCRQLNEGKLQSKGERKGKSTNFSDPSLPLEHFTQGTIVLVIFPQISSGEQLQRMYSERCIIHSCMLTVCEKQECLLSRGAIYHGKYVRPRPVKGWWFCSGVTSDIWLYAGRGLIKATSITQPDNLCTREKQMMVAS